MEHLIPQNVIDAKLWQSNPGIWNHEASKFKGLGLACGLLQSNLRKGDQMKDLIIKEFTFLELAVVGTIGYLLGVALVTIIFLIGLGAI